MNKMSGLKDLAVILGATAIELLKLNPVYQEGYQAGSSAAEPPLTLNQVTRLVTARERAESSPDSHFESIFTQKKDRDPKYLIINSDPKPSDNIFFRSLIEDLHRKERDPRRIKDSLLIPKDTPENNRLDRKLYLLTTEQEQSSKVELDPEKLSFRLGYLNGVQEFLQTRSIDSASLGVASLEVLTDDQVLRAFLSGMRLHSPSQAHRDWTLGATTKTSKILEEILPKYGAGFLVESEFPDQQTKAGYRLGFVVRIAREHGIVLKGLQVPANESSYHAFMQGSKAESRPLPVYLEIPKSLLLEKISKPHYEKEERSLFAETSRGINQFVDEAAYHVGLQVWLKTQGIPEVATYLIRHPEALKAFKSAWNGEVIAEYEPQPEQKLINNLRLERLLDNKILEEKIYVSDNGKPWDVPREPSPAEIIREQAQLAYNLGKLARLTCKSAQ